MPTKARMELRQNGLENPTKMGIERNGLVRKALLVNKTMSSKACAHPLWDRRLSLQHGGDVRRGERSGAVT